MPFDLTPSQKNAVEADGGILVSAAAGSGKTRVLTERVIRRLTDKENPVSADKLLIVTFTNAAALEMHTRIENALLERISENPNDDQLIRQYNLLGSADISTIDSFCINLVRENFEECGVEQGFAVTNGADMEERCEELLSDIIDTQFESGNPEFIKLLEFLDCENDDSALKNIIKSIYALSNTAPFPELFVKNLLKPYSEPFCEGHIWFEGALERAAQTVSEAFSIISEMRSCAPYLDCNAEKIKDELNFFTSLFTDLETFVTAKQWDGICDLVAEYNYRAASLRGDSAQTALYKSSRDALRDMFRSLKRFFPYPERQTADMLASYASAVGYLLGLVSEYSRGVLEAFKENNELAFYHTEQLALQLLCMVDDRGNIVRTPLAQDCIDRYDEVMVDEYQDVNDLQELMFGILSDDRKKLFVVGDVKQSIYGFRGSNPKNFLKKKGEYKPFDEARGDDPKKIILSENFRSRKGVCDFVNFVFERILNKNTGGIDYSAEEVLNPGASFPDSDDDAVDLIIVNNTTDSDEDYAVESAAIAEYIRNAVDGGRKITKNGAEVPISYGDICVLFESRKKAPELVKAFDKLGIPVSYNADDFCKSPEVSLVLSMLSVVDNPLSNVDILTVLMSPLFSFDPDDIASLRQKNRDIELYRCILIAAGSGDEKCAAFIERLDMLRKKSVVLPLSRFISYLIYETGIFPIVSSLDNSRCRRKNLYYLINAAKSFTGGPGAFAAHIRSLPGDAFVTVDNEGDSVKIMTMHKSKGLQFPVCILSNMTKQFTETDSMGNFVYSERFGIAFKPFDEERYEYIENTGIELAKEDIKTANLAERIRLLYVAMTRAEEKLVLVVGITKRQTAKSLAACVSSGALPDRAVKGSHSMSRLVLLPCLFHPMAQSLRDLAGVDLTPAKTGSKLNITVREEIGEPGITAADGKPRDDGDSGLSELIKRNISFVYPDEALAYIPAKTSVSALTHTDADKEFCFSDRPAFMNDGGISPTEKGTAVHKIMQFIRFSGGIDIESEIERLVEWQFITEKEGEAADREKLNAFFATGLYKRIIASNRVERELRFLTEINAGEIYDVPDSFKERQVIVQGAVDLLFFEDGGIVVVDFKTDRVASADRLVELYRDQLRLYAAAVSKKFGLPVKESFIYSFHLSQTVKVEP